MRAGFVYGVRSVPIARVHHAACMCMRAAHALLQLARRRCQPIAVRAVPYVHGAAGSNACPTGSTRIDDPTVCQNAAVAIGTTWGASGQNAGSPKGCYLSSTQTVFLNTHATGSGAAGDTPLCAGAPASIALRIGGS